MDSDTLKKYVAKLKPTAWGRLLYYCVPFRRGVVWNNLQLVFGQSLSIAEIKHVALAFYSHLARSLAENIALRFQSEQKLAEQVIVLGAEHVLQAAEQKKGVLLLAGHFGNWELAPMAAILNFKQYQHRFHVIRKTIGIKFIERLLFRRFDSVGLQVIAKKNALEKVCEVLEKNDAVIFIFDQHASIKAKDGIAVDFFGKKAGTYRSLAMIAQYSGAPVIPSVCYRREDGKHVAEFLPALPWIKHENAREEIRLNTLQYNQVIEQWVLAHPEQWLWMHKRWKQVHD